MEKVENANNQESVNLLQEKDIKRINHFKSTNRNKSDNHAEIHDTDITKDISNESCYKWL